MTRHILRLDPETGAAYCTECGKEFLPPFDPEVLQHDECRPVTGAPGEQLVDVTTYLDESRRYVRRS